LAEAHPLDAAATVPDLAAVFAQFAAASADARRQHAGQLDLRYGPAALETLDLFAAGPGTPLAVFIHGGYWRRLDKSDFSLVAAGLVPLGISVASINYGLAPHTPLREIVAQARRAVGWLIKNARRFDVDASRLTLAGHSAGGHLAAMCAVQWPAQAVVTLSGLHDLIPIQRSFVNEWLGLDETEAIELSPIRYAPAGLPTVLAAAGERESDAFKGQGRALVDAWAAHGCVAEYRDTPSDNHFTICQRLGDPDEALTTQIAALISR
jgi:arylformamidase